MGSGLKLKTANNKGFSLMRFWDVGDELDIGCSLAIHSDKG